MEAPAMRKDTRPVLLASTLPACDVNYRPDEETSIVCPECRTWRVIAQGRIFPHPGKDGTRCDASARRFAVDVPYARLESEQRAALADAGRRRAARTFRKPAPPVATPLHRLAAA
jgi:hypothetical protein